jgi:translation elongation factor EF-Tu-like GTPase
MLRMLSDDFEMIVSDMFVIAGRGTVAAGEVVRGAFSNGDIAQIWHHDRLHGHSVAFVEMHVRPGTVALILTNPDAEVRPGDLIRGTSGPQTT